MEIRVQNDSGYGLGITTHRKGKATGLGRSKKSNWEVALVGTSVDCREPTWGIPPVAKVMRKEARYTQRLDLTSGVPPGFSWTSTPKNQSLLPYCTVLSTLLLLIGINLGLQLTVFCIWKECFSSNHFDGSLTCLTGSPGLLQFLNCLQPPNHERHKA